MKTQRKIQFLIMMSILNILSSCKKDKLSLTPVLYFPQVKSIIQNHCLSCHGTAGTFTGRPTCFDTDEQISSSYKSIKAAVADPVSTGPFGNKRMPQDDTLSADEINTIVKWFEKGGKTSD